MEQARTIVLKGRKYAVVTAKEAAVMCNCTPAAFLTYSRDRRPKYNPAPEAVGRDLDTGAKLFLRSEVEAFRDGRTGPGYWKDLRASAAKRDA